MVYLTGDIHGRPDNLMPIAERRMTEADTLILLGDVGANYYGNRRDLLLKHELSYIKGTVLCIHGNHEMRPHTIPSYKEKEWNGGTVWYEEEFPKLLFAKDGEVYTIENKKYLALGGAYSVDKFYRLSKGYGWWEDEQPSDEVKARVKDNLASLTADIILSHTCPLRYIPTEMFLPFIDQSTVDQSTEEWLGEIEAALDYKAWFCGHWHIDKRIDKMHFLFNGWETVERIK